MSAIQSPTGETDMDVLYSLLREQFANFAKNDLKTIETIVQMARASTGHSEGYMVNDQELV